MDVDTVGMLCDREEFLVSTNDDIGGGNLNFLITEELDRGVYYLEVSGASFDTGDYQVLARFDLIGDDHGGTIRSSSILPLGPRVAGNMNDPDDVDWFRLDFPVGTYAELRTVSQNPVTTNVLAFYGDAILNLVACRPRITCGTGIGAARTTFRSPGQ